MSSRILVVTAQGEVRYLGSESEAVRVLTIQPTGARGEAGAAGVGVPTGGATNDILKKTSATNYATAWETPTSAATENTVVRRDASGGAAFVALTGTGNWNTTGHFFSNPGTAEAGHFLTKNGTTPTIAAGRSAWFSSTTGAPQFKNGTGGAVTLLYNGSALGTPASGTLTNCTGLPIQTGVSGLSTNMVEFLEEGSAANLQNALGGQYTGGGAAVFATSPTLTTPILGIPTSGTLTSCTGLPISTGVSGLGTGVATLLTGTPSGTGGPVGTTSPTITTPTIATINGGTAANDDITIQGTTNATRTSSYVIIQPNGGFTGIGTSTPALPLHIVATNSNAGMFRAQNSSASGYTGFELYGDAGTQLAAFGTGNSSASFYPGEMYLGTNTAKAVRIYTTSASNVRMSILSTGEVGIGTTTPSVKSVLDLTSTTKGFLPPRMTTVERDAITSVPAGLMIYNTTTNKLNFYNGSAWEAVTSV